MALTKGMVQFGWTKMVAEETPNRLADLGIHLDSSQQSHSGNADAPVQLNDEMVVQMWGNWDP